MVFFEKRKMTHYLKIVLTLLLTVGLSSGLLGQTDTTKVKQNLERVGENTGTVKSVKLKAKTPPMKKAQPEVDLKTNKKINPEAVNKKLYQQKKKTQSSMLLETLPEDRDIIGKKYWQGKDVTHQRLKSNMSLGTVSSTSETVKIECRDHAYIDGDRIRIYVNEKPVSTNIGLKYNYYVLYVNLEPGYNRIDFQALNQGLSGPNTAELIVYDDKGTIISAKEWNLATGETATLGIIKK